MAGAATYQVFARRTDAAEWGAPIALVASETASPAQPVTPDAERKLSHVAKLRGDDWIMGVSACSADGLCSPVASAVPGGGFVPLAKPEGDKD